MKKNALAEGFSGEVIIIVMLITIKKAALRQLFIIL